MNTMKFLRAIKLSHVFLTLLLLACVGYYAYRESQREGIAAVQHPLAYAVLMGVFLAASIACLAFSAHHLWEMLAARRQKRRDTP